MAKSKKTLAENQSQLKANKAELKQLYALDNAINDAQFARIELLEKENVLLEKNIASEKRKKKAIEDSAKAIRGNNKFLEDTEDILGSIADKVGKQHGLYKEGEKYLERQKKSLSSIATLTESVADPKLSKAAEKATDAYKVYQQSVARVADRTAMTGKQQEEANVAIARARAEFDASVAALAQMGDNGQQVLDTLNGMADETEKFAKSVTASTKEFNALDNVMGSFSGIPAMSELNTLLKTNIKDTFAFKAAVFALGAALGKAAMDYFGAPMKAQIQQTKEVAQLAIDGEAERAKIASDKGFIDRDAAKGYSKIQEESDNNRIQTAHNVAQAMNEAAFAGQKAAIQFSAQMQSGAAQFERAAKTALFGNKLGGVGYGAAQMALAGISADKVAAGMEAASAATGRMPSAKVGADMAIMAERTGTSVDNIASINEMFQRMDGVSESTAMNLSEGLRNMADQAKIGLGGLMREIADASKDALSYQIKSGPALAKQVAYAQSLGVSFGDIAKAGKSMVMNYKDSIKQEMQLSAMLGKNVDLSEVRAKFASGDQAGAMEALKAQGLDPASMDMFQQDALSQALGGMDLSSLQKIATKSGAQVGGLQAGKAGAGNQDFLSRTQAAESTLAQKQASISANTAVLDAKLSGKIADEFINSDGHKNFLKAQADQAAKSSLLNQEMESLYKNSKAYNDQLAKTAQNEMVSGIKENLLTGLSMVLGGVAASFATKGVGILGKGLQTMFSKVSGGGGGGVTSMATSMLGGGGGAPPTPGGGGGGGMMPSMPGGGGPGGGAPGGGFTKGLVDSVKNVSTVLKSIITELGAVLKSGVDVVMQLANKLASGVMTTFNTIMSGLSKASSTMPTILGNLGKAIGSFFSGMGSGLVTFAQMMATPTALFGLPVGLIVMAMMMGLAAALRIAGPGIEALTPLILGLVSIIGDTFVKALQAAGPIITSIFEGIGLVIEKVGNAISGIINSITDSISRLGGLNPAQLLAVAGGIAALAGAVAIFGGASAIGGFLGAIGEFFGGDPVDKFLKFQNLDPAQLQAVATSITNLAKGISAFGVLESVAGVSAALTTAFTNFGESVGGGASEGINSLASGLRALNEQLIITTSIAGSIDVVSSAFLNLAYALDRLASVNTKALNDVPWIRMTAFAGAGGRITLAQSANNSFNIAQDTAKNIEKMAANTEVMVKLNNTIAKLIKEGFFGGETTGQMKLYIDGKDVSTSMKRYQSNTQNQDPKKK